MSGRRRLPLVALGACALLTACVPGPPREILGAAEEPTAIERAADTVLRIRSISACGTGTGSGFVVEGGRIVTNRHVIEGASRIQVETWDGRRVRIGDASVGVDTDIGVIELPRSSQELVEALPLSDDPPAPGAQLTAVGYAQGGRAVSTRGQFLDEPRGARFEEPGRVLRMNMSVRPGNSGGPLLDGDADVVGVVFAYERATLHALAVPRQRLEDVLTDPAALEPVTRRC